MTPETEPADPLWRSRDGRARAVRRPDGRWQLRLPATAQDAWPELVGELRQGVTGTVITTAPEDPWSAPLLRAAGLVPVRRIQHWSVPIDAEYLAHIGVLPGDEPASPRHPTAHRLLRVTDADPAAVVSLDNTLRHEIPGTAGWQGTEADLREDLASAAFDPELYLVVQDKRSGDYAGLIRVWLNEDGPRLGCVAVRPAVRGTRVTGALIRAVATELVRRGYHRIIAETAATHRAAVRLARRLGASATRVEVEWATPDGDGPAN
ncbi:GNAT family N-acetyltransferase [Promicromonospora iranensis]|uniref:N-acetyltransferase YhbS n=1 Tax=Promicromonospora iranensis TaxID=1105144 RepID=A0ABU2CKI8_9MICO|nr:GNAT family N-acetyltransferase [Promicromonospora iranensis]MDR7381851.1 putative N-acetyltransferase YhbS [Promicromonospora iranensis]